MDRGKPPPGSGARISRRGAVARLTATGLGLAIGIALQRHTHADTQETVDLELVLAVDASGSVNQVRFEMQKRGYVDAFRSPRILKAIRSGSLGRIAVTMMQWTGPTMQVQVVPWMLIAGEDSVDALARRIEAAPRQL